MTEKQRVTIETLLRKNRLTREEIAIRVGVSPRSVSAVKAVMTMRDAATDEAGSAAKDLLRIIPSRKSGSETFHRNGSPLGFNLLDFWCWCNSDLLSNAARGRLAEYLVALDLKVADGVRSEWVRYDTKTSEGVMIEVKSASYIQTWAQRRDSIITFDVRPTLGWDPDTAKFGAIRRRQSNAYVFALIEHRDRATIDPLNVEQWLFHVVATRVLDAALGPQKSLSLERLRRLKPMVVRFGRHRSSYQKSRRSKCLNRCLLQRTKLLNVA
jgi:hypothetical protein